MPAAAGAAAPFLLIPAVRLLPTEVLVLIAALAAVAVLTVREIRTHTTPRRVRTRLHQP